VPVMARMKPCFACCHPYPCMTAHGRASTATGASSRASSVRIIGGWFLSARLVWGAWLGNHGVAMSVNRICGASERRHVRRHRCPPTNATLTVPDWVASATVPVPEDEVEDADEAFVPLPSSGRVYIGQRRVRLGDATPGGRLRFDALVRYVQDVA